MRSTAPKPDPAAPRHRPAGSPWAESADVVARGLEVSPAVGLSPAEVQRRREQHGANALRARAPRSRWAILVAQFRSILVALLAAASGVSLAMGEWLDALAVLVVLVINAGIGFFTELSATRSMEALRRLGSVSTVVRRDGKRLRVDAVELVPGDILVLEGGDAVTADLRLLQASRLQANESLLTGESLAVDKTPGPIDAGARLADRTCMLYRGTSITRGSAEGVVVATGMATEIGHIAELVEQAAADETTPLEKRLDRLGRALVWVTLAIAASVAGVGLLGDREPMIIVQTAIALAVASVPEGLPIIATIALARGMHRMARKNALVRRLSAVETLGATSVIFTDKTGTLTENRMTLTETDGDREDRLLTIAALCNNAALSAGGAVGDPMEVALLEAAAARGLDRAGLDERFPRVGEHAFDSESKMMATVHRDGDDYLVAVKGAPEAVLAACTGDAALIARLAATNAEMAGRGLRVLACAEKRTGDATAAPYRDLSPIGLLGLMDPPRTDVPEAIAACKRAGVRVVMLTGDQAPTARSIARQVGIAEHDVHARVSPADKLGLIAAQQAGGAIVAMTGDGVNDAPALRKANIGVAMGARGTEVAREASDMVLCDDAFATIVAAIAEGRVIFDNIRAFIVYLLSCNLSEILVVALATATTDVPVLLPLQILFLNMVTDVFPALALGVGEGADDIMERPPRPHDEPVITRAGWATIAASGLLITVCTLAAFGLAHVRPGIPAMTVAFATLAIAQLWHVFNMRSPRSRLLRNRVTRNRVVWGAVALSLALVVAAIYLPPLARVLNLTPPGGDGWALIAFFSVAPLIIGQLWLELRKRLGRRSSPG